MDRCVLELRVATILTEDFFLNAFSNSCPNSNLTLRIFDSFLSALSKKKNQLAKFWDIK